MSKSIKKSNLKPFLDHQTKTNSKVAISKKAPSQSSHQSHSTEGKNGGHGLKKVSFWHKGKNCKNDSHEWWLDMEASLIKNRIRCRWCGRRLKLNGS